MGEVRIVTKAQAQALKKDIDIDVTGSPMRADTFALKVQSAWAPAAYALHEATIHARIAECAQPYVPVFHWSGIKRGRRYILMEHVVGVTLRDYILEHRNTATHKNVIAQAVTAVKRCKVHHNDLHPENIIVSQLNGTPAVKIIDFGQAAHFSETNVFRSLESNRNYATLQKLSLELLMKPKPKKRIRSPPPSPLALGL